MYEFYKAVPDGYDLLGANREALYDYGIPERPDRDTEPRLYEFWKRLVSPPFHAKRPTFHVYHPPHPEHMTKSDAYGPLMGEGLRDSDFFWSRGGTSQSSLNWSGAIISPPWPKRFILATAGWKAPKVRVALPPPVNSYHKHPKALVWVGLDGYNGGVPRVSLPQIGTAHFCNGQHFAWWAWWCNHSTPNTPPRTWITRIKDFVVQPKDEILAGVSVLISHDVLFFIKNQRTGQFRSFLSRPPHDILPLGASAEWVVERPTEPRSRNFHALADYGRVDFKYCMAVAGDGPVPRERRLMTLANNGRVVNMREAFLPRPHHCGITYVSRAKRRPDKDGSIGVTCTFHQPT
jgi:hypothetical protein